MGEANKYQGNITTEIFYNDRAETQPLTEKFQFGTCAVTLLHDCDDGFTTVAVGAEADGFEDFQVFHSPNSVLFTHEYGEMQTTPKEIFAAVKFYRSAKSLIQVMAER